MVKRKSSSTASSRSLKRAKTSVTTIKRTVSRRIRPRRYKRRNISRRRRARPSRSFNSKVLRATSVLSQWQNTSTGIVKSLPGKAGIIFPPHHILQAEFNAVTARLSNNTIGDPITNKSFFTESATKKIKFLNGSQSKCDIIFYYYMARNNAQDQPINYYLKGFSDTGTILNDDPTSTPFQSPDFVSGFKITRVVRRTLEQGQHYTAYLTKRNFKCTSDLYGNNAVVKGTMGVFARAVGTLGVDSTVTDKVTTTQTQILWDCQSKIAYRQMADNAPDSFKFGSYQTAIAQSMRYANSDAGTAITGTFDDIQP
ncbi:capsid protein [Blackfly DNA Virus 13]|nr:capsid protein [Blackfly DNA Virus 13]